MNDTAPLLLGDGPMPNVAETPGARTETTTGPLVSSSQPAYEIGINPIATFSVRQGVRSSKTGVPGTVPNLGCNLGAPKRLGFGSLP